MAGRRIPLGEVVTAPSQPAHRPCYGGSCPGATSKDADKKLCPPCKEVRRAAERILNNFDKINNKL